MASFTFFPSIPRSFEVRELLRVAKALKPEEGEPEHKRIERAIVALMEQNREVERQSIYGLTAVALFKAGMLDKARSSVCTLRERKDDGTYEVLSNNHRFYRLPQGVVDPLVRYFEKQGKTVECHRPFRINPYPKSVAAGVLAQFESDTFTKKRRKGDDKQMWFNTVIHRICRRLSLPPDLWGYSPGSTDAASTKYHRMRRKLEGVLRGFTRRMEEEADEHWRSYLDVALSREFPHMGEEERHGLIMRLEDEHGPPMPREIYRQKKKVKLVEPEIGGSGMMSH